MQNQLKKIFLATALAFLVLVLNISELHSPSPSTFHETSHVNVKVVNIKRSQSQQRIFSSLNKTFPFPIWKECAQFTCKFTHLNGSISHSNPHPHTSMVNNPNSTDSEGIFCSDILLDILTRTVNTLTDNGYHPYLVFGTLLGEYFSNQIFGWTHDVDIAVSSAQFKGIHLSKEVWNQLYIEHGLVLFRNGQRLQRVCASGRYFELVKMQEYLVAENTMRGGLGRYLLRNVYLDMYEEYEDDKNGSGDDGDDGGKWIRINPSDEVVSIDDVYPLRNCQLYSELESQFFSCPRETKKLLSRHYGPGWSRIQEL